MKNTRESSSATEILASSLGDFRRGSSPHCNVDRLECGLRFFHHRLRQYCHYMGLVQSFRVWDHCDGWLWWKPALDPSLAKTGASSQRVGGAAGAHGTRSACEGAPIDADSQAG